LDSPVNAILAELEAVEDDILVTALALPEAAIVILPAPLVTEIPVPAVIVANAGDAPVEPINNCPLVIEPVNAGTPEVLVNSVAELAEVISPITEVAELYRIRLAVVVAGQVVVDQAGAPLAPDCNI
jgi:hypothetical protein